MSNDVQRIDLSNLDQSIPTTHLLLLVSVAIAGFFLGGALTTDLTPATWVIALLLVAYMGGAIVHITNTLVDIVHDAAREGVLATEVSYEEDIEGLAAAVLDFSDVSRLIVTTYDEVHGVKPEYIEGLRDILTMIGATDDLTETGST